MLNIPLNLLLNATDEIDGLRPRQMLENLFAEIAFAF